MLACEQLGAATTNLNATTLKSFRMQVGSLDAALKDIRSAGVVAPLARVLLDELGSPDSRAAACDDCLTAFETAASADECELRLRQLRSFVEVAGHDWADRAKLVHEALADDVSAQVAAGADPPDDPGAWTEPAGMTLDERIDLATKLLRAHPQRGSAVVWLAYGNATVEPFYLEKGPLQFYDGGIWSAALDGYWPGNPNWTQPPELAHPQAAFHLTELPEADFVMVRVALARVRGSEAEVRARELADAALALTGWEAEWVPLRGAAIYTNHWFGSLGFLDPRLRPAHTNPLFDPTASELAGVDETLLVRLAHQEPAVKELVNDVRWRRDARKPPNRDHRVVLAVALVERILPQASPQGTAWYEVTSYYLKTLLALDDLSQRVRDAGEMALHARISSRQPQPFPLAREIVEHRGRNAYTVHADRILARVDDLLACVEAGTMEARMLAEVKARTADGASAYRWLRECEIRFERLIARARRQRNAITHGTRTVAEVVASIEPFLDQVAGCLAGALHVSVEQNTQLSTLLAGYAATWEKRKAALEAGADPATELFPTGS